VAQTILQSQQYQEVLCQHVFVGEGHDEMDDYDVEQMSLDRHL
jgi:hypothetical protein